MSNTAEIIRKATESKPYDRGQNPYAEGSRYYDLWNSNPWTMDKMTQKQTWWDKAANFFGFRSAYDTAVDQRNQAAAEYDAQIAQLKGEDEYNSPEQAAARMRAAGENPDLLGVEGGGQAAEFAMEQTPPEITPDENLTRIGALANGIVQAVTLATGLSKDITGTMNMIQNFKSGELNRIGQEQDLAIKFLENWTPDYTDDTWKDFGNGNLDENEAGKLAAYMRAKGKQWGKQNGMNDKAAERFASSVYEIFDNQKYKYLENWKRNEEARQNWGGKQGSRYFTGAAKDFSEITEIMQPLTDVMDDYLEFSNIANSEEAKDRALTAQAKNGTTAGEVENEENEWRKEQAKMNKNMKKAFSDVMEGLTKKAEDGDTFAWLMTLILPGIYSNVMKN